MDNEFVGQENNTEIAEQAPKAPSTQVGTVGNRDLKEEIKLLSGDSFDYLNYQDKINRYNTTVSNLDTTIRLEYDDITKSIDQINNVMKMPVMQSAKWQEDPWFDQFERQQQICNKQAKIISCQSWQLRFYREIINKLSGVIKNVRGEGEEKIRLRNTRELMEFMLREERNRQNETNKNMYALVEKMFDRSDRMIAGMQGFYQNSFRQGSAIGSHHNQGQDGNKGISYGPSKHDPTKPELYPDQLSEVEEAIIAYVRNNPGKNRMGIANPIKKQFEGQYDVNIGVGQSLINKLIEEGRLKEEGDNKRSNLISLPES